MKIENEKVILSLDNYEKMKEEIKSLRQENAEKTIVMQTGTNGRFGFNLKGVDIKADKRQVLRNLVNPEVGLHFFNHARNIITQPKTNQISIFDEL